MADTTTVAQHPPVVVDVDVAVVGAGALGAAVAWHLSRRGVHVMLVERCGAGDVWRAAGATAWGESDAHPRLAREAGALWRVLERETGASLLHAGSGGRQVRPGQAVAALTAAASAWGTVLRHRDDVRAVELDSGYGARLCTHTGTVHARRVVLAGTGPSALVAPHHRAHGPVLATLGADSFAVPALGRLLADSAGRP